MTNDAPWSVGRDQAITRWEMTPVEERPFAGQARPMPDQVDYRFRNGFTDVGNLPCRDAFHQTMVGRTVSVPGDGFDEVYLSDDTELLDFSGFWHEPTHVSRFARCVLTAADAGRHVFRLSTCGGVRIWVNRQLAVTFEPFDRNTIRRELVDLPLAAGANEIVMHLEDLCERDTTWVVELRSKSQARFGLGLSVPVDLGTLFGIERCIGSLRLDKSIYGDEQVDLIIDSPPTAPLALDVRFQGMHRSDEDTFASTLTLTPDSKRLPLCKAWQAGEGCRAISLAATHDGVTVSRTIGGSFIARIHRGVGGNSADRKREGLAYLAMGGGREDPARALANLHLNHDLPEAERLLTIALDRIKRREDCSDFAMVPLLWAWQEFKGKRLSDGFWLAARREILAWRYWLDEPGNDVMWFWSENHVLCFHASQYLAGQNFPDDVFVASGRTGSQQRDFAHERLIRWFDSIDVHGLAEWNSSAYYPIDFIGLFALEELAEDSALRDRARRLIDMIFVTMALHTQNGILGGTMGRSYEKELLAGPAAELSSFAYVGWGEGWIAQACAALPMYCLTDYEPPTITKAFVNPAKGSTIEAAYTQGVDHSGRLRLWKDASAQLSTIVDHQTGEPGHQQHVVDVLLAGNPFARFWVNHPGDSYPWSHHRPSYWAGNGRLPHVAQHGPVALLTFQSLGPDELPWTHLLAPRQACDESVQTECWLFVRSGDGFAGFCATEGLSVTDAGQFAGDEWRSFGTETAWVVTVGSGTHDAFSEFQQRWRTANISFDKALLRLSVQSADGPHLVLERGAPLVVDGEPRPFAPLASIPHVSVDGGPLRPWTDIKPHTP